MNKKKFRNIILILILILIIIFATKELFKKLLFTPEINFESYHRGQNIKSIIDVNSDINIDDEKHMDSLIITNNQLINLITNELFNGSICKNNQTYINLDKEKVNILCEQDFFSKTMIINLTFNKSINKEGIFLLDVFEGHIGMKKIPKFILSHLFSDLNYKINKFFNNDKFIYFIVNNYSNEEGVLLEGYYKKLSNENFLAQPLIASADMFYTVSKCNLLKEGSCFTSEVSFYDYISNENLYNTIQIYGNITKIKFNSDYTKLVVIANIVDKEMLKIYELKNNNFILINTLFVNAFSAEFGFKSNEIIIGMDFVNSSLSTWDIYTGEIIEGPFHVGHSPIFGIELDNTQDLFYSITSFGILAWDIDEIVNIKSFSGSFHVMEIINGKNTDDENIEKYYPDFIAFDIASDGKYIISEGRSSIIIWDTVKMQQIIQFKKDELFNQPLKICSTFYPNTHIAFICSKNNIILIYDIDKNYLLGSFEAKGIQNISIDPVGRFITLLFSNNRIKILDLYQKNKFLENEIFLKQGLEFDLNSISVSQTGVGVSKEGEFYLYSKDLSKVLYSKKDCSFTGFSVDSLGKKVGLGCNDGTVKVFDIENDELLINIESQNFGKISTMVFSEDSEFIYLLYQKGLFLKYDVNNNQIAWQYEINHLTDGLEQNAIINSTQSYLAFSFDLIPNYDIGIWDISKNIPKQLQSNVLQPFNEIDRVLRVSFSPDGKLIAMTKSLSEEIIIYDLENDEIIQKISSPGMVGAVAFIDNSTIIVSKFIQRLENFEQVAEIYNGSDLEIWDINEKLLISTIEKAHLGTINTIINLGEQRVITSSLNGEVKIWDFSQQRLLDIACSIANRNLFDSELDKYIPLNFSNKIDCSKNKTSNIVYQYELKEDIYATLSQLVDNEISVNLDDLIANKFNENISLYDEFIFNSEIEEENIQIENPAILQCRKTNVPSQYVNQYIVWWPISFGSSNGSLVINEQNQYATIFSEQSEENNIELTSILPPGNINIVLPKLNIKRYVLSDLNDEKIIKITMPSLDYSTFPNLPTIDNDLFEINYLSSHTHPNTEFSNANFPQHSLQLIFKNYSLNHLKYYSLNGIVYNQEGKVIDFLMTDYYRQYVFPVDIPPEDFGIISAKTVSISGRCVGYSNIEGPYSIRYWLGLAFEDNENSENLIYVNYYDEIFIGY